MRMMAIAHRVEAREASRTPAGAEHVVGADGGRIGQPDLDDLGTESSSCATLCSKARLTSVDPAGLEQEGTTPNAHAADAHVEVCGVVDVARLARAIERVTSRDGG